MMVEVGCGDGVGVGVAVGVGEGVGVGVSAGVGVDVGAFVGVLDARGVGVALEVGVGSLVLCVPLAPGERTDSPPPPHAQSAQTAINDSNTHLRNIPLLHRAAGCSHADRA